MWWRLTARVRRDRGDRRRCAWCRSARGQRRCSRAGKSTYRLGLHWRSVLLLVGQAVHLPANVLLTRPNEARWQALWTLAMAAISIGLGCAAAERFGAVGVVYASALAIFAAQVLPDLLWVPRLVRRRPRVAD